jgi:hypothetical protein
MTMNFEPAVIEESPNNPVLAKSIQENDWHDFPVGKPESRPHALRNAVDLTLGTKCPMLLMRGKDLYSIYNDAFIKIRGERHPDAPGMPGYMVWADIWHQIRPILYLALSNFSISRFLLTESESPG